MSGGILFYFSIVILFLGISGCLSEPQEVTPTPIETASVPTVDIDVKVSNAPTNVKAGQSFEISWRVDSTEEQNILHTAIHYGPESKSDPVKIQSYPNLTTPRAGLIPADFKANITINKTGTTYFRAHAIVDGENFWSNEMMLTVATPENVTPPMIKVTSYPSSVTGDTVYSIKWNVSGGTPGDIGHTAVHWGFKSGGADIADYSEVSAVQTGKTPMGFTTSLTAPASRTVYFRAHAIVDGEHVYSDEYTIRVISPNTGGY